MSQASFKYINLAQKLMRHIASTGLQPGDRLPTEDDLVQEHGLSRITVRRALSLLEADGLIFRKRKAGTFLNRSIEQPVHIDVIRGTIAVILSPLPDSVVDENNFALAVTLRSIEQSLADRGINMQVMSTGRNALQDRTRLMSLAERDDIIGICAHGPGLEQYRELLGTVPTIYCCMYAPGDAQPWVGWNLEDAVYPSVQHLLEFGHERIALVAGSWVSHNEFAPFIRGYKRAFEDRSLPFHRNMLYHACADEPLPDLIEQVLTTSPRPTAILAQDWRVARATITAVAKLGLSIPQDISVIALGENAQHIMSPVALTTFVPDNERVGHEVVEVLIRLIDNEPAPESPVYVPGRLITADSVSAPRIFP
jgi:GntR family transcriptional regulator of arabinose operon